MSKAQGCSVHKLLGAENNTLITDMTIGIDSTEEMVLLNGKKKVSEFLKLRQELIIKMI